MKKKKQSTFNNLVVFELICFLILISVSKRKKYQNKSKKKENNIKQTSATLKININTKWLHKHDNEP